MQLSANMGADRPVVLRRIEPAYRDGVEVVVRVPRPSDHHDACGQKVRLHEEHQSPSLSPPNKQVPDT